MAENNHEETQPINRVAAAGPEPSSNGAENGQAHDNMARAEEIVDRLAERMARLTAVLGKKILWLGVRLREEAEDIWTEAQSIRRGEKP